MNRITGTKPAIRSKIGGAVPISAIANRATSGSRLHHQQQQNKSIQKDGERRAG